MKFFLRFLPNGRVLVKNTDMGLIVQPQVFANLKEATEFIQNTVDQYGAGAFSIEDPTGIEAILGGNNDD